MPRRAHAAIRRINDAVRSICTVHLLFVLWLLWTVSGSAMSCTVLYACLFPYSQLLLYGIIPVPAWAAASGLIALDAYRSATLTHRTVQ